MIFGRAGRRVSAAVGAAIIVAIAGVWTVPASGASSPAVPNTKVQHFIAVMQENRQRKAASTTSLTSCCSKTQPSTRNMAGASAFRVN